MKTYSKQGFKIYDKLSLKFRIQTENFKALRTFKNFDQVIFSKETAKIASKHQG